MQKKLYLWVEVTEECIRPDVDLNDRKALYTGQMPAVYAALEKSARRLKGAEIVMYRSPRVLVKFGHYWVGTLPQYVQDWVAQFHQQTAVPISFHLELIETTQTDITNYRGE